MTASGHNGGPRSGWIAVSRDMREHWLVGFGKPVPPADPEKDWVMSRAEAWLDLLMECQYEAGVVNNGGQKMLIKPGQLLGAVSWLAARWNWTPKTVRGFLDKLENDEMIERVAPGLEQGNQKGKQAAVISVCNYSEYQVTGDPEGQAPGQSKGKQRASKGQAEGNIYKDNNLTIEQDTPPTPSGGVIAETQFDGEPERHREGPAQQKREASEAVAVYNLAAEHFGFAKCATLTDARIKRIGKRLTDIGGLDRFKTALRAIARDDPFTRFVRGKAPPRPGEQPFRLDIDRLLQSDGNLGDVLARLLDLADAAPTQPRAEPWAQWSESEWEIQIRTHANGVWPVDKIGFWPGHKNSRAPPGIVAKLGLTNAYNENGMKRK